MLALYATLAVIVALGLGYMIGRSQRSRVPAPAPPPPAVTASAPAPAASSLPPPPAPSGSSLPPPPAPAAAPLPPASAPVDDLATTERARLIRSYEADAAGVRRALAARDAALVQLGDFAAERRRLFGELGAARAETARYRQLVIDLEDNAPPPILGGPGAPDDLKLIVGVGPVLERMLYQLGVTTYRQIARWSERDIDDYDARLHEFPGRIRRDGWVTQARALHLSKYGATPPPRDPR